MKKLKYLFLIMVATFMSVTSVYAVPTGEIYSETNSTNITLLAKFQYASDEVRFYGRSGSGQSSPFIPSLSEFRDGNYSLFTYQQIPAGNRTAFGMHFYLNQTLMSGKSYTSTFKVGGIPSTIAYYFDNAISINNANINSKSVTCLSSSCYVNTTFTMSSSTNELHIDFMPPEGLNGSIFVDIFTGIFMVQVEEYNYTDTSGIQNNQQIIIDQNEQIIDNTDKLNDLNENITNDNVTGVESSFESFEGFIAENSTITQLITMPITLYTAILNGVQSTCQPFPLGDLFGTNLTLPCINIANYLGSGLWTTIDIIISGFAIFTISKKFIKIFNNFSSMKEGDVIND